MKRCRTIKRWFRKHLAPGAALLTVSMLVAAAVGIVLAAQTLGGFEVDADLTAPERAFFADNSTDWAAGLFEVPGVFAITGDDLAADDCYSSDIFFQISASVSGFVCDGHDDPKLSGGSGAIANEVEQNIVTPAGKQPEDNWSITDPSGTSGLGDAKSDFTHAYVFFALGDSCADMDTDPDDPFLFMAGNRADNEGDAHWGFEFDKQAPNNFASLVNPPGIDGAFILDFNRTDGDLLVSANVQKVKGQQEVNFELFQWDTTDFSQSPQGSFVPSASSCGAAGFELTSNVEHDIEAPPWNVPVCDKTSESNSPQCRLAAGDGDGDTPMMIDLLAPRDFIEVGVDLNAFGITDVCFTNFIFTSRSSTSITSDLKDVGGADLAVCGANIQIEPDDTNEVGEEHTFDVTVNQEIAGQSSPVPDGTIVTVELTDANGAVSNISSDTCADPGTVNGMCSVTFSSDSAGTITGHASATVTVFGNEFFVETDATGNNSGDAVKTFVDAKITIEADDTNEVAEDHTFTVEVMVDDGDGTGFDPAPDGTIVTVELTDANGAVSDVSEDTCAGPGTSNGECSVTFTSDTAGTVTGHASVQVDVGGVTLERETDDTGDNSGDVVKTFVDAFIEIEPDDTNEAGDPHTFTVTVWEDDGSGMDADGMNGNFDPAAGEDVDFTLTDANGATFVLNAGASTCDDAGANTDANGQCTIVFTSNSAGTVTGHASVSVDVGGLSLDRETDGVSPNSDDAVKTFVDAFIEIEADDTNEAGDPHTFTVTVWEDDGSGTDADGMNGNFDPAAGEDVDFTLTNANGATFVLNAGASTCDDAGANTDANGQCTIVFTSNSTGTVTGHASANVQVGGLSLFRETNGTGNNSGDAVKRFVDAFITVEPDGVNNVNTNHTFTIHVEKDDGSGGGFVAAMGVNPTFMLTDSGGADSSVVSETCSNPGTDEGGNCTVTITSPTAGTTTIHASVTLLIAGISVQRETDGVAPNSDDAVKEWVVVPLFTCTPGFWGNHGELWDGLAGNGEVPAAFAGGTLNGQILAGNVFPYLDPSVAGTTYLGIYDDLQPGGDQTIIIARQLIAGELNVATQGDTTPAFTLLWDFLEANPVGSDVSGSELPQSIKDAFNAVASFNEENSDQCDQLVAPFLP